MAPWVLGATSSLLKRHTHLVTKVVTWQLLLTSSRQKGIDLPLQRHATAAAATVCECLHINQTSDAFDQMYMKVAATDSVSKCSVKQEQARKVLQLDLRSFNSQVHVQFNQQGPRTSGSRLRHVILRVFCQTDQPFTTALSALSADSWATVPVVINQNTSHAE